MVKKLIKENGHAKIADVAESAVQEEAKRVKAEKNEDMDAVEKGKRRVEAIEAILYGGSKFGRDDD